MNYIKLALLILKYYKGVLNTSNPCFQCCSIERLFFCLRKGQSGVKTIKSQEVFQVLLSYKNTKN